MEKILLVLHGSPKKEANYWDSFLNLLSGVFQRPRDDFKIAFLQFGQPDIKSALEDYIREGTYKIIVHPFFLSSGLHVSKDIPEILEEAKKMYPEVEILYTRPLGVHEKLAEIVKERIEELGIKSGSAIEIKSFEIIEKEVDLSSFSEEEKVIIKRVIHATADPEFKYTMVFHEEAIPLAIKNLKMGKDILVDVEMVKAGISKKLLKGNQVLSYLSEITEEPEEGTRTEKAIELALEREKNLGIIAIGNSPTALIKAVEILNKYNIKDIVVIGMPVGFVKALESKLLLSTQNFPFITNLSRKGGSPACSAVINALLRLSQ
ncbi:hypothetical protein THC_0079 [Caldimicrobium thiodismutans]|uniref:Cobalamin biosynthesis precorrin-8X methylmutase CobH/CbiC domain-containing protein n=1 Tax=Caldimicrobium thiodismutans TaxID=1653476 RepID=A0A0U5BV65_9BACT|nr:precorrin-8X methylmutase [Caldimicrobium thiodismutans]BAU22485.1 hypothetical protein THC_0079 [Caldimicrobium thiodismutans]